MSGVIAIWAFTVQVEAQSAVAPTGVLRAAYLASNPAQATTDPATGAIRGTAVDLANELARRLGVPVAMSGLGNPAMVIEAVRSGKADIGFVAYNPEREGPVRFSRPYMLVMQTFLVRESSTIKSVADIDRPNQRIGATRGDSISLYLGRNLKQAQRVEITETFPGESIRLLEAGKVDAFGANRQRLSTVLKSASGLRILPDDLYGVEQTLIVPTGKPEALAAVDQFLDDVRRSGFLQAAIDRSGVVGIGVFDPAAAK
jgi:polar amino acid transport system substrate-binding protein